jgi:hypothetical protein
MVTAPRGRVNSMVADGRITAPSIPKWNMAGSADRLHTGKATTTSGSLRLASGAGEDRQGVTVSA